MAFPTGKYARYKSATTYFLNWVLDARGLGRNTGQKVKLAALGDVVKEITADPSTLTPKLLNSLPKALAACQCSITLREHVAKFFAGDDKGQPGHQHFLGQLGETLNEAFAEDLRLEVVYFFLELEELVEGVFEIYADVKKERRTMVEATVAVQVAIEAASALTASLQLKYPSLKTAEDVGVVLMDNLPDNFWRRAVDAVGDFWRNFAMDGSYKYVPGMLIVEFRGVLSTVLSFTTGLPDNPRHGMVLREGYFGEVYGEERTPQYAFPDSTNMVILLLQQLPHLYNAVLDLKMANRGKLDTSGVAGPFMGLLDEFFQSRQATVPLVFACICWVRSVAALQGDSGLTRNVGVTIKHSTGLLKRIKATAAKRAAATNDFMAREVVRQCAEQREQASRGDHLARANPLMAGFTMLTYDFQYFQMASDVLTTTSRVCAFCHLYNALVGHGFLTRIPFIEDLLTIYEEIVFTPSRDAAVRGVYNRTYLLSAQYTATSIDQMYRSGASSVKKQKNNGQNQLSNLSKVYQIMIEHDNSVLGGASSKAMLFKAADICSKELFQSRILSRDLLTLNGDLADVFSEMADDMSQQQTEPVENAAMMFVMPFLDGLQPDGSMDMSALPGANRRMRVGSAAAMVIKSMCGKAAAVIKAKFSTPTCEQKYFTFPSKPNFATQKYGPAPVQALA